MRRLAPRALLACALLSIATACTEPVATDPLESVVAVSAPLAEVGLNPGSQHFIQFGGTGGDTYFDYCPAGMVATGTSGTMVRYNGTAAMYQLRLRCRVLNVDGTFGASITSVGGRGLGIGLDAYAPFTADCPAGSVVVGAHGVADGIIRAYGITCSTFGGARTTLGPWTGIGFMPPSAVPYANECLPGYAIAGVISHAGYILDGMEFRCIAITGLAPTATFGAPSTVPEGSSFTLSLTNPQSGGGVLSYEFDCGSGYGAASATPTATCVTTDDASLTARGRISSAGGGATEYTAAVSVTNVAPVIAPIPQDTVLLYEWYLHTGSFTDPGADSWSAHMNYGTGFFPPVALFNKTFTISKTYSTAGVFSIVVNVTDGDGGVGSRVASIVVLAPAQAATGLRARVSQLAESGDIPQNTAQPLNVSLANAARHLDDGKPIPAQKELEAFKHKVDAAVRSKKVTETVAAPLKKSADRIIESSKKQ